MVLTLDGTTQHDQKDGGSGVAAEDGEEDEDDEATADEDDDDGNAGVDDNDNEPCEDAMPGNALGISKEPSRESRRLPPEAPPPPSPSLP